MNVIVIGGGAAGFFAAIHAAENGCKVTILEKSDKLLSKVKVSGGGRCNVTNGCDDPALFVRNYPRGFKELKGPLSKFNRLHTIDWFARHGVELKTEPDGRMFPVTNSSQTIIDTLMQASENLNIKIQKHQLVERIQTTGTGFLLNTKNGTLIADKVIIATGGNPSLSFYNWLTDLGHTLIKPVPSLFTFNIPDNKFQDLMGVAVADAHIKICDSGFEETGPLLFTHWGLSGPAILKLSAWAARHLFEKQYQFSIKVNFLPAYNFDELRALFIKLRKTSSGKRIFSTKIDNLPSRLWMKLVAISGIYEQMQWGDCSNENISHLIDSLQNFIMEIKGKTTFKEEFVTCGGISLKEVNMKTMESKIIPGVFFAGEILDIDGITGGFNFQAAWTTGYLAGISCVK